MDNLDPVPTTFSDKDNHKDQQQIFAPGDEPISIKSLSDDTSNIKHGIKDCLQINEKVYN